VVISLGALIAWSCALLLRHSAEQARALAIGRLRELLYRVYEGNPQTMKDIQFVIDEIKSIREGTFAPLMQHPLVQALAVPFGGVGGVYLIDFFAKMNI